mmetsp:Transcript_61389/g.176718  ORF Transcript_61389/g.176718 Transcript_61389/m.176718 type:complete len:533 (-) Transcript_61389:20-1618(-)
MGDRRAITSSTMLIDREIPSHLLRVHAIAARLLSYMRLWEVIAVSQTQRGLALLCRADVRTRRKAVYVLGGSDGRKLVTSGLRLDFEEGCWEPLSDMRLARAQAAGGVVAGRVFLCGGSDAQAATLRCVECFNPGTKRWEAGPPMSEARSGATAVPVEGQLIVCGGRDGTTYLSSVERFAPRQMEGVFSGKVGMGSFFQKRVHGTKWRWRVCTFCRGVVVDARDYAHQRAILRSWPFTVTGATSIEVLTQGGVGAQESVVGLPAVAEGMTEKSGFLGVAIRDNATNIWLACKRRTFCGGSTWKEGRDPENGEGAGNEQALLFTQEELAPFAGTEVTIDVVDFYHGAYGWIAVRRVTIAGIDMAGAWEPLPPMASKRCYAAGGKLPGRMYVCGGIDHPTRTFSSVESFDPLADGGVGRWEHAMPMSVPRASAASTSAGGCLYVCGGHDGGLELPTIERLSSHSGQWEVLATMSRRRRFAGAVAVAGALHVFGGFDGKSYLESGERFDERRFQWEGLGVPMPAPRALAVTAVVD